MSGAVTFSISIFPSQGKRFFSILPRTVLACPGFHSFPPVYLPVLDRINSFRHQGFGRISSAAGILQTDGRI